MTKKTSFHVTDLLRKFFDEFNRKLAPEGEKYNGLSGCEELMGIVN